MKNKTTAILLSFFLGGLGIHRFYLKQIGLGIVYLLFSWTFIPLAISIIDFVVFLVMTEERFNEKYNKQVEKISPQAEYCSGCNSELTIWNTPNFGAGKLKDGGRVCTNCSKIITKIDSGFLMNSKKKYDKNSVAEMLSRKASSQTKSSPQKSLDNSTKKITVSSLVKSVQSVKDLKNLEKNAELYRDKFSQSGYENTKYEKLEQMYEDALHKSCNTVFYYQFLPDIELEMPQSILDFAYEVIEAKDYKTKRKEIGGSEFEWSEILGHDLIDSTLDEAIEEKPFYWETYLKFREIVKQETSYEEKNAQINDLANSDKSFLDEFFSRDSSLSPGEQWVIEKIRSYDIPLVDRLYNMGYTTPEKIAEIDLEKIKEVNGFGPQKVEQLRVAVERIKSKE